MDVIVIDDSIDVLQVIKQALQLYGHNCDVFSDKQWCLELIDKKHYNVAIIDYKLGKLNGLQVIQSIKNYKSNIKCVIMSAYFPTLQDQQMQRLLKISDGKLNKPITIQKILNVVTSVI